MSRFKLFSFFLAALAFLSCNNNGELEDNGFSNVNNPRADKLVSVYGETVTVTFEAAGPWDADIVVEGDEEWASIFNMSGNKAAGKGTIKVKFLKNTAEQTRTAVLYVTVQGHSRAELAAFEQSSGKEDNEMSDYLVSKMEERLSTEYLWAAEYNKLEKEDVSYDEYLFKNLSKLGDINIEDGGYYRDYSSYAGQRYIYSYIQELNASTKAEQELAPTFGLGIGPLFASLYKEGTQQIGLTLGYVYRGSPAEQAGLRRGDTIWNVNGVNLTYSNYQNYMYELFYSPSGSYEILYSRYDIAPEGDRYILNEYNEAVVTAASFGYDPVLFAAILSKANVDSEDQDDDSRLPDFSIGYMATESFDLNAQFVIENQIQQFIEAGIKDLVLDLRFNVGGAVPQSRYLASAIAGKTHDNDIFFKAEYVDGRKEDWTFGYGYSMNPDGLEHAPELGLSRLFVIVSENTASASELLINGLRGIDFPVTMIGSRTEGKNVGMVVSNINYNGRVFEFAPITFRCSNGRDEGDYKDGFEPTAENLLNNQNKSYDDDIDNVFPYAFGDWGDFNFNYAFYFCFCDIIGEARPDFTKTKSADGPMFQTFEINRSAQPVGFTAMTPQIGRFGNVIYK